MADVNLNLQYVEMASRQSNVAPSQKVSEAYKVSTQNNTKETIENDDAVVATSALYVITPDGVIHARKTNDAGEVNYAPSITIQSYYKTTSE